MAKRNDPDYFRFAHIGWVIPISTGLTVLTWAYFDPEGIPWIFGPLGQLGAYLGKTYPSLIKSMFYVTFAVHVIEALYSIKVCRDKNLSTSTTMKWCLQTFLVGFASFLRLNKVGKAKTS
ncbi:transmembrane protein 254-like [Ostrea edulis]|uniref:transmembrane protein 254-like n=1 Tax=Ostrea edulis TaxID=37623 RepID=UPI00209577F4|nr:transmembrane protein 254-like [Ostrea edulis]